MQDLLTAVGGIGVFLLGMVIMTEGLKALAGARISEWLADATRSLWSGAVIAAVESGALPAASRIAAGRYAQILAREDPQREKLFASAARDEISLRYATECAEALRWLTRVSRHIGRICFYLERAASETHDERKLS